MNGQAWPCATPEPAEVLKRASGNDIGAKFRERGDPGDKAGLKGLSIQGCKQIAELIMLRRAVLKGPEPTQEVKLLLAELGNLDPTVGARAFSS